MKRYIAAVLLIITLLPINYVQADSVLDHAFSFLKSKQDSFGKISTGFSAPSQWSAIAFAINGVDLTTVKNSDKSLKDFLLTDIPTEPSSPTDWENRILSIVAIGDDPTNFGGINYVQNLESFYNNGQIGDTCSLNDDIFGLLSLIAAGNTSTSQIKQDTLNFIIQKQDAADGGFGFSVPGCEWYSTSADMTGAAIQVLEAAKENSLTNSDLDVAILKAKNYLLKNQNADGAFGYFGSSDSDTTGWVLMAFNVLGLKNSTEALKTQAWLLNQQSSQDGGFQAFDYGTNSMVSNSTTTAQSIIALSGKGWILKIFTKSSTDPIQTATPSTSPSISPSSSPTPNPSPSPALTPTPSPLPSPTQLTINVISSPSPSASPIATLVLIPSPTPPNPSPEILGEATASSILQSKPISKPEINMQKLFLNSFKNASLSLGGILGLITAFNFLRRKLTRKYSF